MIKIILEDKYKSLTDRLEIDLPDFTIISGINGAGKSHLLSAVLAESAKAYDEYSNQLKPVKYVNSSSLSPNDSFQVGRENLSGEVNSIFYSIKNYTQAKIANPNLNLGTHFQHNLPHLNIILKILESSKIELQELTVEDISEHFPLEYGLVSDVFYQNFSTIFKRYYDKYEDNFYHNI